MAATTGRRFSGAPKRDENSSRPVADATVAIGRDAAQAAGPSLAFERACWAQGAIYVAGVDEVGRGAWAGPVVAAAVILPPNPAVASALAGVDDSKKLLPRERERLATLILKHAVAAAVGQAPPGDVDRCGLLPATARAMERALALLPHDPDHLLLDGLPLRALARRHTAIVRGDALCLSIAAASIVAKVARDRLMGELDGLHPGYAFAAHKGYGAPAHVAALHQLGPSPAHRLSYAPVAAIAAQSWA